MPPRLAKRGSASAGPKMMRSNRGVSKSDNPPPEPVAEAAAPVVETREKMVPEEIADEDKADEKLTVDEKVVADEKGTDELDPDEVEVEVEEEMRSRIVRERGQAKRAVTELKHPVDMDQGSKAMDAFKHLQRRDVLFGVDRPAKVSFADSFIDPGDEIMAQDHVRELLKKYGEIEKIELARNMPSADRKDYGFVTFDSHDAAVTCAKSINNTELGEGNNKAKVRARLSRPHQRGRGKHHGRDSFSRAPPPSLKRSVGLRDRRPIMSAAARSRPLAPPPPRSYDRRALVPPYPKSTLKREYGRRNELPPPRSRDVVDYGSGGYADYPRSSARPAARGPYMDDDMLKGLKGLLLVYHEGRGNDYDSMSGSKRTYSALDDVPPRYADAGARHSRARLDYELAAGAPPYVDAYDDRFGRSSLGYGGGRSSIAGSQDSHGLYGSRQGMSYGEGSFSGSDAVGMYSSGYGGDYMRRDLMLVVVLTRPCILAVVWVAAVTWVVGFWIILLILGLPEEVSFYVLERCVTKEMDGHIVTTEFVIGTDFKDNEAAVGCGKFEAFILYSWLRCNVKLILTMESAWQDLNFPYDQQKIRARMTGELLSYFNTCYFFCASYGRLLIPLQFLTFEVLELGIYLWFLKFLLGRISVIALEIGFRRAMILEKFSPS
ncbi:Detected protein of confused Function [Hibiscus syriacus]|uniref:Detected protein of confused Function n=1 Tax=Hibiscus syriacus TaxID=106335 RepID=A0A6A2WZ44_HIBSY|nr:Detected protein of confused Function [Hibiscus syriacus]